MLASMAAPLAARQGATDLVERGSFRLYKMEQAIGQESYEIRRDGDSPKVEIHDPLEPHEKLLGTYTDKDIHDLTAYLVTLK